MRILQVTKHYYPALGFGGPVQCTYNISKYLAKRGHDVTVYTTDALQPRSSARVPDRMRVIEGAKVHFFPNVATFFEMFISPDIFHAFRNNIRNFDVIHLHEYRSFQNIAFVVCSSGRERYVLQTHGLKLPENAALEERGAVLISARKAYDYVFGKRLLRGAAKVIALSESEKASLEGIGLEDERTTILPNGVAPEDFSNSPGPDLFRERFGITEGRVILYVGRIAKSKRIETLVKAFYLLSKERTDVKLAIVGPDDGYLHVLKEMVRVLNLEGRVLFAGFLAGAPKLSAYSSADVVVYPGVYEGFPIVPLEAAIMARPLVVSNDPGMAFVGNGDFGLTFHYGNEHELLDRLETILDDTDLGKKLGANGKKCVLANYTWEVVGRKVEHLYEEILNGVD
jgi:glycosyltransferase involved in cell wall biosynthesis